MPGIASSAPAVLIGAVAAATRHGSGSAPEGCSPTTRRSWWPSSSARSPPCTRAHRPRPGPSSGHRPHHRGGPATQRRPADDFPEQLMDLVAYLDGAVAGPCGRCPTRRSVLPCGCWDPAATARSSPGCSACRSPSPTTSWPTTPCRRSSSTDGTSSPPTSSTRRTPSSPCRCCAPRATRTPRSWRSRRCSRGVRLRQGRPGPLPSPESAAAHEWSDLERSIVAERIRQAIGGPDRVRASLAALLEATAADEADGHDHHVRPRGAAGVDAARARAVRRRRPPPGPRRCCPRGVAARGVRRARAGGRRPGRSRGGRSRG